MASRLTACSNGILPSLSALISKRRVPVFLSTNTNSLGRTACLRANECCVRNFLISPMVPLRASTISHHPRKSRPAFCSNVFASRPPLFEDIARSLRPSGEHEQSRCHAPPPSPTAVVPDVKPHRNRTAHPPRVRLWSTPSSAPLAPHVPCRATARRALR